MRYCKIHSTMNFYNIYWLHTDTSFKRFLNQTTEYILLLKHPLNHLIDNLTSTLEWLENWSRFLQRFLSDLSGGEARVNKEPIMTYQQQYIPTLIDANLSLNWAVGASSIHWQYLKYHDMLNNCRSFEYIYSNFTELSIFLITEKSNKLSHLPSLVWRIFLYFV